VRQALVVLAFVVGLCTAFRIGWEFGQLAEAHREFERRYAEEQKLVAPVLAADPAFRRIVTVNFPVAGICLAGYVETRDDYNRLRAEIVRLFGEPRIGHVMQDVVVERAAEPAAALDRGGT
jgi:hypothetical protein